MREKHKRIKKIERENIVKPLRFTMILPSSRGFVNASRNEAKIAKEFEIRCSTCSTSQKSNFNSTNNKSFFDQNLCSSVRLRSNFSNFDFVFVIIFVKHFHCSSFLHRFDQFYSSDIYWWNRVTKRKRIYSFIDRKTKRNELFLWFRCFLYNRSIEKDWRKFQHQINNRSDQMLMTILEIERSTERNSSRKSSPFDATVIWLHLSQSKDFGRFSWAKEKWKNKSVVLSELSVFLPHNVLIKFVWTSNNCLIAKRFFAVRRVLYFSW